MDAITERRPELALDQVNNVRPTAMVPTWMVANFFYRFLSRALRDVALPLLGLFLLLHVPIVATLASGIWGRLGSAGELNGRLARWALLVAAVDLVLLAVVIAFVGRTLQRAVAVYGGSPEELASAWLGLPPVFVPAYPCTWIEVETASQGVEVRLWERRVTVPRRLFAVERLLARGRLPTADSQPPRLLDSATLAWAPAGRAAQPAAD